MKIDQDGTEKFVCSLVNNVINYNMTSNTLLCFYYPTSCFELWKNVFKKNAISE